MELHISHPPKLVCVVTDNRPWKTEAALRRLRLQHLLEITCRLSQNSTGLDTHVLVCLICLFVCCNTAL